VTQHHQGHDHDPEEHHGPTVRDKRRIDPETYQVREPRATAAPSAGASASAAASSQPKVEPQDGELDKVRTDLAERTADLQRLQAEYVNYKRRVDRDREVSRTGGIESVLKDLLHVVDDIRSAREHEELTGGFKAVAEEIERVTSKYGLESYGTKGDAFDPHIHEALLHSHIDGIDGPTCVEILQPGYRVKDKIIRPARVAVAEPDPNAPVVEEREPDLAPEQDGTPEAGADDAAAGD
jgi:molecular chaperone GrpE